MSKEDIQKKISELGELIKSKLSGLEDYDVDLINEYEGLEGLEGDEYANQMSLILCIEEDIDYAEYEVTVLIHELEKLKKLL